MEIGKKSFPILTLLGVLSSFRSQSIAQPLPNVVTQAGNFSQEYRHPISRNETHMFFFRLTDENVNRTTHLRLLVSTDLTTTLDKPLYVNVIEPKILMSSIEVPFEFIKGSEDTMDTEPPYYSVKRTLCVLGEKSPKAEDQEGLEITILISTHSSTQIYYTFMLERSDDFLLEPDTPRSVIASPSSPAYFGYVFHKRHSVQVRATTGYTSNTCLSLSIQTLTCPMFDLVESIHYQGLWETVSSQGSITVERKHPFLEGFAVVVVVHNTNRSCTERSAVSLPAPSDISVLVDTPNEINITLTVFTTTSDINTGIIILCLILPIVLTLCVVFLLASCLRKRMTKIETLLSEAAAAAEAQSSGPEEYPLLQNQNQLVLNNDEICVTMNTFIKNFAKPVDRSWLIMVAISLFYFIPVCQFALYYFSVAKSTGDYDMCYYNFLCAHKFGPFLDFNHIISNLAYVILGITFILFVQSRERRMKAALGLDLFAKSGTRLQYREFNELGWCLVMEGLLSASYHLCPNQHTFQFDTMFMYVIAILLLLNIHHRRNPRILNTKYTFSSLTAFLLISVLSFSAEAFMTKRTKEVVVWPTLIAIQTVITVAANYNYLALGYAKEHDRAITGMRIFTQISNKNVWVKIGSNYGRLVHVVLCILSNILVSYISAAVLLSDLASYVLHVLVFNVFFALASYCLMKMLWSKPQTPRTSRRSNKYFNAEWTPDNVSWWCLPAVLFVVSVALGAWAGVYFADHLSEWSLAAAASRDLNSQCRSWAFPFNFLPPFYDSHDLWHLLSAFSLFLAFTGLLVLDDDLIGTRMSDIRVF